MAKLVKKISLKQGDTKEEFYFDATTGVKGYEYYSTDEVIIGKWVDGRPIYRKTLYIPSLPNATTTKYTLGEDEIDATIRCDGWTDNTTGTNRFNLPYYNVSTSSYSVWLYHTAPNTISVTTGVNRSSQFAYITCEYTKKKDNPDSFAEEEVELMTEHKTGETFDGKPVYEKVFKGTITAIGALTEIPNTIISDLENVIDLNLVIKHTNGGFYPVSFRTSGQYTRVVYNVTRGILYGEYGDNTFLNAPVIATIKYTKK